MSSPSTDVILGPVISLEGPRAVLKAPSHRRQREVCQINIPLQPVLILTSLCAAQVPRTADVQSHWWTKSSFQSHKTPTWASTPSVFLRSRTWVVLRRFWGQNWYMEQGYRFLPKLCAGLRVLIWEWMDCKPRKLKTSVSESHYRLLWRTTWSWSAKVVSLFWVPLLEMGLKSV